MYSHTIQYRALLYEIEKGAVYFADRAYAKVKQLQHIISSNADFVVRVSPFHIKLFKDSQWLVYITGKHFYIFFPFKRIIPAFWYAIKPI